VGTNHYLARLKTGLHRTEIYTSNELEPASKQGYMVNDAWAARNPTGLRRAAAR
jgi:hypothetical protein